jgi:Spy/CpxP family protein refolding chaperone
MAEHLELTDDQVEALRPIFEAAHARHEELRELPREERREAFRTIREETKAAVDEILTEEQRAKLEEHHGRRGRRGFHRGMRHHRRGDLGGGPEGDGPPPPDAPEVE